ncbi:hypothetical protein EEB14_24940 [Rhodococcus sp. WS4]|nr:hypothetical protein EEB14_24940 [Rhodococcus sp. WS4]
MAHLTVPQQQLLREVQDCATAMRRWLATDNNSAALMAHLRHEPVARTWLTTYQRLNRDLTRSIGDAQRRGGPHTRRPHPGN